MQKDAWAGPRCARPLLAALCVLRMTYRRRLEEVLHLLSSYSEQRNYGVVAEILCSIDDVYHPKHTDFVAAFSVEEHRDIAHVYGLVCEVELSDTATISDLQSDPRWRRVVTVAKDVYSRISSDA